MHPAIKKALCEATAKDENRAWLHKIRAYWGHYYHFHVRIACPEGSTNCEAQPPLPNDDGCGKELDATGWPWSNRSRNRRRRRRRRLPPSRRHPSRAITLDQLPAECRAVLASGNETPVVASKPAAPPTPAADQKPAPK